MNLKISQASHVVLMLSGGVASTAALWHLCRLRKSYSVVFVSGLYSMEIDSVREKCIRRLMIEARNFDGMPLCSGDPPQSWLELEDSRNWRREHLHQQVHAAYPQSLIVWGLAPPNQPFLGELDQVVFENELQALYTLALAENSTEKMDELSEPLKNKISCGARLFPQVTNVVCSCWPSTHPFALRSKKDERRRPFLSMCGACDGCARYHKAWLEMVAIFPLIRIGSKSVQMKDDARHYLEMPGLRVEARKKRKKSKVSHIKIEEEPDDSGGSDAEDEPDENEEEIEEEEEEEFSQFEEDELEPEGADDEVEDIDIDD